MPSRVCLRSRSFSPIALAVIAITILSCSTFSFGDANDDDFTIDLIHRDSPKSPYHNPSLTQFEHAKNAFHRSLKRANHLASTGVIPNNGEYLLEISFGTPPFKTLLIADTGSDLTWVQCRPCISCYKENFPLFNPKKSKTFKPIPCTSRSCQTLGGACGKHNHTCQYQQSYGDSSYTQGDLATETITFGSHHKRVSFGKFAFGCGHNNGGLFPNMTSGIVGLGFGKQSLISQLKSSIHSRFSYCLGPFSQVSKSGKMKFGKKAVVSGHGVASTPLILDYYYYLILDGISVGSKRLKYHYTKPAHTENAGNIIIDSGTTITYLPSELYYGLESTVKRVIKLHKIVPDPTKFFSLCYCSLNHPYIPIITVHFRGADVKLKPFNTFVQTSDSSFCLAFAPTDDLAIFGNIVQNNFWVGYDLEKKTLSFKPSKCTGKHS